MFQYAKVTYLMIQCIPQTLTVSGLRSGEFGGLFDILNSLSCSSSVPEQVLQSGIRSDGQNFYLHVDQ